MKKNQKFLLIAPWDYQLYVAIEKNLKHLGYEVTTIHNNYYPSSPEDWLIKSKYFLKKVLSKKSNQTEQLKQEYLEDKRLALIKSQTRYDLCLVIRADLFSKNLLNEAKKRSGKFISFFYDGLTYNRQVIPLIPLFDRFYIFDKTELQAFEGYAVQYAPNFYFDYPELTQASYDTGNKIYYISSYNPCRIDLIQSFHKYISERIAPVQFDFVYTKTDEDQIPDYAKQHFNCTQIIIPYEEQLKRIQYTELIIDFKMTFHSGFSFRIFDGIKLNKKVITNNPLVVNEDFYHPNNFFILTQGNEDELGNFLKRPYVPLDEKIRTKYSFENWLKAVTDY